MFDDEYTPDEEWPDLEGMSQEELYGQSGGIGYQSSGAAGGADSMPGENSAIGNAELHHQFLLVVVTHESDVHGVHPFVNEDAAVGRAGPLCVWKC